MKIWNEIVSKFMGKKKNYKRIELNLNSCGKIKKRRLLPLKVTKNFVSLSKKTDFEN
jgi:hypothetical protein